MYELRDKEQSNKGSTEEVEEEYIIDILLTHSNEEQYIESDVQYYEEHLKGSEFYRLLTESKEGERNGLQGIDSHTNCHNLHIFCMTSLTYGLRDFIGENKYSGEENSNQSSYNSHSCREDSMVVFSFFIGKAEEGGLHSEGKDDKHECHECIQVCNNTISTVCRSNHMCIEWHQQIVQESTYY